MGIEFELILMNFYEVISKFHSIPFNSLMTPIKMNDPINEFEWNCDFRMRAN